MTNYTAARRGSKTAGEGDIVIIGAGLAGLFTALRLAPLPVTVIAAAPLGEGASSVWAQGGIAAAVGEGDTPSQHAHDTIVAGAGIVDELVAKIVAEEGPDRIRDLLKYGVPFDRDLAGHFVLSREAAHSQKRVVRVSGDRAGFAIMQALIAAVRATPSIRVLEHYEAEDLILTEGRVTGLRLIRSAERGNGTYDLIPASAVVLATGGIGSLYAVTTNPAYARGEAIAFAARAGAVIADAEFVQFHPTAMDLGMDPAPLATEALRGEGATLINGAGERFMTQLHPDADLAPRDIVARGVFAELAAKRGAFLDARDAIGARFAEAFPTNYAAAMSAGIDPTREPIPVAPAAHYHMGGVSTDLHGRTSVLGLWAAGEVASTGLHGANRLASNSLLEAAVFGARVADDIRAMMPADRAGDVHLSDPRRVSSGGRTADPLKRAAAVALLRETMTRHVGVIRNARGLRSALTTFTEIEKAAGADTVLANMALAARLVTGAALMRKESRGGHFRSDYPDAMPGLAKRSFITIADLDKLSAKPSRRAAGKLEPALPL
ncbi:MAG: L-aspartate oxidase [Hyphomicrobiaceae bacterium]|nr:L-aspartate oxidase [Hyphomicrobiaceae bacterium]